MMRSLSFTMPADVQEPANTAITALLIDNKTGKVVNADRMPAASYDTSDITIIESEPAEESNVYYTLDGVRVDRPSKGLYIIRYADGRCKKAIY